MSKTKFEAQIGSTDNEIKLKRMSLLKDQAKQEQEALMQQLDTKKRSLELELAELHDLNPETTVDLKPGGRNFSPQTWVKKTQDLKEQILDVTISLDIATNTYNEWFVVPTDEKA